MVDIASCIPMQQEDPEEKPFETLREGMSNGWLENIAYEDSDVERASTAYLMLDIRAQRKKLDAEEEGLATRLVTGVFPGDGKFIKRRKPINPPKTPRLATNHYHTPHHHSQEISDFEEFRNHMKDSIAFLTAEDNFREDELTGLRKDCQDLKESLEKVLGSIKEELDALQDGVALALNENAEHEQEHLKFTPRRKPTVISSADFDDSDYNDDSNPFCRGPENLD